MSKGMHNLLRVEHFHAVDAGTCQQTMAESDLDYSIKMADAFTIHHGMRYGSPIVIVEHHDHRSNGLSGVWYDESK